MNNNEFTSFYGNSFYMEEEVIDRRYCSIREIGYLIVPDGRLIVVSKGKHHGEVFLNYLSKYLEKSMDEIRKEYQIFSDNGLCFLSLLEQYQCIPYFGIGMNPIFPLYRHCICENSKMFDMRGILHIPSDLECMTEEQVLTNQSLIETNIDFRGKEKYPMHIANTNSPHISYSSIEFLEKMDQILNDKKKKLIK